MESILTIQSRKLQQKRQFCCKRERSRLPLGLCVVPVPVSFFFALSLSVWGMSPYVSYVSPSSFPMAYRQVNRMIINRDASFENHKTHMGVSGCIFTLELSNLVNSEVFRKPRDLDVLDCFDRHASIHGNQAMPWMKSNSNL